MNTVDSTTNSARPFGRTDKHAEARWGMKKNRDLGRVEDLMSDLYFGVKCGFGAAEYNLEEAGMIEMIFPHVAGEMRHGDNGWNDTRYTITKRGRRTNKAELKRIVLRDPPLEIALSDAKLEALDVADDCGGCDPDDRWLLLHKRILQHLIMRVERIVEKEKAQRTPTATQGVRGQSCQDVIETRGICRSSLHPRNRQLNLSPPGSDLPPMKGHAGTGAVKFPDRDPTEPPMPPACLRFLPSPFGRLPDRKLTQTHLGIAARTLAAQG